MLFWLADLVAEAGGPALFRFSTTRVVLAFLTAFVVGLLLGRPMILWLYKHGWRSKERVYGDINTRSKSGTPIMGGALILASLFISVLLWCDLSGSRIWVLLASGLWFAWMGSRDDLAKVRGGTADAGMSRKLKIRRRQKLPGSLGMPWRRE